MYASQGRQQAISIWLPFIRQWYPDLATRTYFLPPLHFNRVPCDLKTLAGQNILVLRKAKDGPDPNYSSTTAQSNQHQPFPVLDKDVRDDRAQERVFHCLRALADNKLEVMVVVSQLEFGKYLNKPCYTAAAAYFPQPISLPDKKYHQGDFDVLIIHRTYGLITAEVKSVGDNFNELGMTKVAKDAAVSKKVLEATKQLKKAEVVLKYLVSDLTGIEVRKALILPNITSTELEDALNSNTQAAQELCQCLSVQSITESIQLCLCADQMSDRNSFWDFPSDVMTKLSDWWHRRVSSTLPQTPIDFSVYENMVARFCGPATTVEVHCVLPPRLEIRTEGEGVSETGERLNRLALFPEQVDVLNASLPLVFLSGPPGTGKTLVLTMQGLKWLRLGHDVHVVSTWNGSLSASMIIESQLNTTMSILTKGAPLTTAQVHRHQFNFRDKNRPDFKKEPDLPIAIDQLSSTGKQLCILADEIFCQYFTEFCERLLDREPGTYIWAADMRHDVRPPCLAEVKLTIPLRSPPVVIREVKGAMDVSAPKRIYDYTTCDVPSPTDGPAFRRFRHKKGERGHTGRLANNCEECGHQIARVLDELNVGKSVAGARPGPPPLHYRDVLILCDDKPHDDRMDAKGQMTAPAIGLVKGLRACHVPIHVVERDNESAFLNAALALKDEATVMYWEDANGLERKVVFMAIKIWSSSRHYALSRSTSQLVFIDIAPG